MLTSIILCYVGGAVMFTLHCVLRGEHGPALNDWYHWLLDSSVGFLLLTPVLGVLIPLSRWIVRRHIATKPPGGLADCAVLAGLFTLVTVPGPTIHGWLLGADTPMARMATSTFGEDPSVAARMLHRTPPSLLSESLLQVLIGAPVYLACTLLAFKCLAIRDQRGNAYDNTLLRR